MLPSSENDHNEPTDGNTMNDSLADLRAVVARRNASKPAVATESAESISDRQFELLINRAETSRIRREQEQAERHRVESERRAEERAKEQAYRERMDNLRLMEIQSIQQRRSSLPEIPSAETAARDGVQCPAYSEFAARAGTNHFTMADLRLPEGAVLPMYPTEAQALAYGLAPAFASEYPAYMEHFKIRPMSLVKMWLTAMCIDAEGNVDKEQVRKPFVEPHELRHILPRIAAELIPMNPRPMEAVAATLRKEKSWSQWQAIKNAYLDQPRGSYVFFQSVVPTPALKPTDWCGQVDYPANFPLTRLNLNQLDFINRVVHYRLVNENGIYPAMARWLAEQLIVITGYQMTIGKPLTPEQLFRTAYRFSTRHMAGIFGTSDAYYGKTKTDRPDDANFDRSLLPPLPLVESHQPDSAKHPDAE